DQARAAFDAAKAAEEAASKQITQAEESLRLARTTILTIDLRKKEVEQARERLKEARAAVEVARARIQSAEARRALAQANVADTSVVAPFAGTVLRKLVEEGEVVAAGTPLVTFLDLSQLHVKVYIPERDIGKVKLGNPARVYVDAFPKRFFEATVAEVSQEAEFTPRDIHMKDERVKLVFAVKLALNNPEGFLKPGMPADARIRWNADAPWGDGPG
ncbi:MAG: HlyD family secretion protein, partial [Candidatus Methylomirabilota bacterium]